MTHSSMTVLREHFPERLISIRGDLEWPVRSTDYPACDFLFVVIFVILCLCQLSENPTRLKGQRPRRNDQYTH
uniref:Uncharacterized protein n=1 Tax=Lepeophtheirus salmonis TaxID=72036 RepID=A0A0K2TZT9_LEPSM